MIQKARRDQKGSATVTLSRNIVTCRLQGEITGSIVRESMRQTEQLAEQARLHGSPRLLLDVSKVTKQDSEARSRAKALSQMGFERVAVTGGSRAITTMGRYIARAAGMGDYTKFFRRETEGRRWLGHEHVLVPNNKLGLRLVAALLLTIIAVAALLGWLLNVPALRAFVPDLRPMHPAGAVTLLAWALSLLVMGPKWRQHRVSRMTVKAVAAWSMTAGAAILLSFFFENHSSWYLVDRLRQAFGGPVALSAATSSILLGGLLLLQVSDRRQAWRRVTYLVVPSAVALQAMTTLVMYSYGFTGNHIFQLYFAAPLNTVFAVLIFNHTLGYLGTPLGSFKGGVKLFNTYWPAIVTTVLLVLITGMAWRQTKQDIAQNITVAVQETFTKVESTIESRLGTYSDALNGYRGLFAASDSVAPHEFHQYFVNSKLATNYPGFSAISYAAVVPEADKNHFVTETQAKASAAYPAYKSFTIFPDYTAAVHYPLLYVEPGSSSTRFGFDLASEALRRKTLEEARDAGESVASPIIDLNASRGPGAPRSDGFFISTPLYKNDTAIDSVASRREHIAGFVIAYFRNDTLFDGIFKHLTNDDARFTLIDTEAPNNNNHIYKTSARRVAADAPIARTTTLKVGDRVWRLNMATSPQYGVSGLYSLLPGAVLAIGLLLSALVGALVVAQMRRREQALEIASHMTEDLNNERNKAVTNQQKDEAILSSIGDAVFAVDTRERITLFNQACESISGYSAAEAIGRPYSEVLKFNFDKTRKTNASFIKQALAGHVTGMKNHTVLVRKDGRSVPVADSAAPILDTRGKLLGAIVVFRDVSKEQELDRAKTEFVSLASHQLRTPLSAVNWYGEMLLGGDAGKLNDVQADYVREIYEGNQRMVELVNSLLNVSRLEVGKLINYPVSPVSMEELAANIEKELTPSIKAKHLIYQKDIHKQLPPVVADPKLLRMIIQNFLSNAVKYTPDKGAVHIAMRRASDTEVSQAHLPADKPYFFMSVSDTGYGIPKAQQDKIFSKLFRADNVRALDVEGTGLGLYIVKEVAENLGGRVWFTSKESLGSTFYALLPFETKISRPSTTGS